MSLIQDVTTALTQMDIDALPPWLVISGGFVATLFILWVVKWIVLSRLETLFNRTSFFLDTHIIRSAKAPLNVVILSIGLVALENLLKNFSKVGDKLENYIGYGTKILLIMAMLIFFERLCSGAVHQYSERSFVLRNSRPLILGIMRAIFIGLGALVILGTLGVSITPLIASLGISSLAVALALQPTLENFFSGIQMVTDKPIRVGDYIELDSGEQGFVEKIGWRSTWIKMLPNNTVIMPNSKLAQSKIINYFYPTPELSVPVEVGVHYDSDLEHVESVTVEVAKEILKTHEMGVETFEPFMNYHTFDNSSINFTVILRGKEYFNRFFITSAFIKALHKRYQEEGITIPYPIRAINTTQEQPQVWAEQNGDEATSKPAPEN